MRNVVERMDSYRTLLIKTFLTAFSLLFGFLMAVQLLLNLMRPRTVRFSGPSAPSWKRYIDFSMSIQPAMKIFVLSGLFIFGLSLAGWLLYKRKLAAEPEVGSAVRDERIRLFWLFSFRKAVAAVIALHLLLWILRNTWPFFVIGSPITTDLGANLMLFVLVVTSLGTFLRLDRRATKLAEKGENPEPSSLYHLTSFEATVARNAPAALGLYLVWHGLFIVGRIYWNWRLLKMDSHPDGAGLLGYRQISGFAHLVWIIVLAVLVYLLLVRSKKAPGPVVGTAALGDERVLMNWLKACRFSFLLALAHFFVSVLPSAAITIWADDVPHEIFSSLLRWETLLMGFHLGLLVPIGGLLGSYIYFNRKD